MHVHIDEAGTDDAVRHVNRLCGSVASDNCISGDYARDATSVNDDARLRELLQRGKDGSAGQDNHADSLRCV